MYKYYLSRKRKKINKYYKDFDCFKTDFEKQTNINTSLYNFREQDNSYIFTIKDELLVADNLIDFLKDFFCDIYDEENLNIYCDDIYEDIKLKKSTDELIKFAKEKFHQNFQFSRSRNSVTAPFMEQIYLEYEYIVLYLNGKTIMECYNEFFSYLEKLLRARHSHPHSGAMKIFLD